MTARNRSTLAALFQNGDVPQGQDYADIFDSFVSLTDSSAQTVTSKLVLSGTLETPAVSAVTVNTATVSCESIITSAIRTNTVSANSIAVDDFRITTSAYNAGTTRLTRVGIGTAAPAEGLQISVSGDNNFRLDIATTVVASAGVSGPATPASVAGFVPVVINGVKRLIAFYNVA